MKKMHLRAFAFVLSIAFFPAASPAAETAKADYEWKSSVEYPKFGEEAMDAEVRKWLAAVILPAAEYAKMAADLDLEEDGWSMGITFRLHYPSRNAVSIEFETFTYARGAAHPLTHIGTLNLATPGGRKLELADLFEDPDRALELFAANAKRLIQENLARERPEAFPEGFADMIWFEDGFAVDADNYRDLILEPEGVRVCFQQYQVLPYVFGISTPLFPLDLLEPAGPNREIWPLTRENW